MDDEQERPRLTDGRERLGEEFADGGAADRRAVGESFADPNSADDGRLGTSFAETNSSAKKHHRPVGEAVAAPFKKPGAGKVVFWIVLVVAIVFVLLLLLGWLPRHNREKAARAKAKDAEQNPQVDVVKVVRAKEAAGLTVPGTTSALVEAPIYARVNGYLRARYVDIGDRVHKGQLLAVIDAPDLDQQVDQAREQVRQAESQQAQQQAQLALTRVTVERYRALVARGVFSRQEGDQRETDFAAQQANVAAAARNVEAFKANLRRAIALQSYERVTAPFDGVVTQRNVDAGALISASGSAGSNAPMTAPTAQMAGSQQQSGATNTAGASGGGATLATPNTGGGQGGALFTVAQVGRLRILVSVPEGYVAMMHPGVRGVVHFEEKPNVAVGAQVTRNAGALDQNTRTLLTELQVDNRDGALLPGMYAVVTFAPAAGGAGPLVVSGDAIAIRNDKPTVAVVEDDKVHLVPISIGRDYGSEVEVLGGLREGELIASSFTDEVRDGAKVRVHENKEEEQKQQPAAQEMSKPKPPGGSTQYSDPAMTDANMQGQTNKPQQKKGGGEKSGSKSGEKP